MAKEEQYQRFADLSYEDFRRMASDPTLSRYEKIGFPDSYRQGREAQILADIRRKLPGLDEQGRIILDVGPGCSDLPQLLIDHCRVRGHNLLLLDSAEMLGHLPDEAFIRKWPAYYPDCPELFADYAGRVDVLISYSVFHYIFTESNIWRFIDRSLELLAPGGQMLIGDIPNISKRKRFFASANGRAFHRAFTGRDEGPEVRFNVTEADQIDDAVVMAVLQRVRAAGYDAYVLPQATDLPMANRREDILIARP
jgi:cyclopropane fatty-acyl-phospholipid synthase-like methyltransferase